MSRYFCGLQGKSANMFKSINMCRPEKINIFFAVNVNQPAHPHNPRKTAVFCFLDFRKAKRVTYKFSEIELVAVAEQPGLSLMSSKTPKTVFLAT